MTLAEKPTIDSPPSYSEDVDNESTPTIPPSVYLIPRTSPSPTPSDNTLLPEDSSLPSYDHVKVDIPPEYPSKPGKQLQPDHPWDLVPVEPQEPWPITKKLYIAGFLIWPLWYIGMAYSLFGRDPRTRVWGKRCLVNSFFITVVYVYIVVAICKAHSHSTSGN